jgi:Uma2 family endonuclease
MAHEFSAPWAERVEGIGSLTADELFRMGQDATHGYELVEGVLVRMAPTGFEHGDITSELGFALNAYIKPRKLGKVMAAETGYILSAPGQPDTVLAPDVSFVRAERLPDRSDPNFKHFQRLVPDLVAEVASPDQHMPEMAAKARVYLTAGVRLVWIVWPATQTVDVWRPEHDDPIATLNTADALDGLDVVPGFTGAVADLFR